ncbi:uncharacterized protein LOC117538590 [Gymnodraco acuticeps]|uniref:Uncharacterized protein LOC117538590 n=1 Tax=Gymnodraco acuticeps TaxID=8218 RepID=A0A6P8T9G0_GYMAC|nr:uncharacterized protein LOC117538590 [Gymnodraco acuticeps]
MNARHSLICFFFLTLRDGNSGLTNAQNLDRTETEGGNFRVSCSFTFSGGRKLFCKGKCEEGNILVETTGDSEQRGRYSIRYNEGTLLSYAILYVGITKLTKSDAGRYQCGLVRSALFPDSYQDIEIRITDAPTSSKPEVTLRPFPTSAPSASPLTTTQSLSSIPSSASPERTTQPPDGVVLYVGLILLVMFIVLSVVLLIFCRKRARKEPPMETEYISDTEAKDDPGNLNYSEVDFSKNGAAPLHSAPCGDTDNVLYSDPRVAQSSDVSHAEDASLALYSTISLHQM